MAGDREIGIIVKVRDVASGALKTISGSVKKFGVGVAGTLRSLQANWLAAVAAIYAVKKALDSTLSSYIAEEKQLRNLNSTLNSFGFNTDENKKKIDNWINGLQAATFAGDDLIRGSFLPLLKVTKDVSKAMKLTEIALGLAGGEADKVAGTTQALTSAFGRSAAGLIQYGIVVKDAKTAEEKFNKIVDQSKFALDNLAASVDDTAGKIQRLRNYAGDAGEEIGKGLAAGINGAMGAMTGANEVFAQAQKELKETGKVSTETAEKASKLVSPFQALGKFIAIQLIPTFVWFGSSAAATINLVGSLLRFLVDGISASAQAFILLMKRDFAGAAKLVGGAVRESIENINDKFHTFVATGLTLTRWFELSTAAGEAYNKTLDETNTIIDDTNDTTANAVKSVDLLSDSFKKLNIVAQQTNDILSSIDASQKDFDITIQIAQQNISLLTDDVAKAEAELSIQQQTLDKAKTSWGKYSAALGNVLTELDKQTGTATAVKIAYDKLAGSIKDESQLTEEQKKKLADLKAQYDEAVNAVNDLTGLEDNLRGKMDDLSGSIRIQTNGITIQVEEIKRLNEEKAKKLLLDSIEIKKQVALNAAGDDRVKQIDAEIEAVNGLINSADFLNKTTLEKLQLDGQLAGLRRERTAAIDAETDKLFGLTEAIEDANLAREIGGIERGMIAEPKTAEDIEFNKIKRRLAIEKEIDDLNKDIAERTKKEDEAENINRQARIEELQFENENLDKVAQTAKDKLASDLAAAKLTNEIAALERTRITDVKTAADVEYNLALDRKIITQQIYEIEKEIKDLKPGTAAYEAAKGRKEELEFKKAGLETEAEKEKKRIKDAATTTYFEMESALSSALRDGFESGESPIKAFANKLRSSILDAASDFLAKMLMGQKMSFGFGGGGLTGTKGEGGGGGLFGGGGLTSILGIGGLLFGLSGMLGGKSEKAPIARPEAPTAGTGGGEFGGTRPLYGSRRMQLAQFSSRNIGGALQKMAAEGPTVNVEVTLNDKGNFQKEVVTATVKQMGRERRRGLRRHEY